MPRTQNNLLLASLLAGAAHAIELDDLMLGRAILDQAVPRIASEDALAALTIPVGAFAVCSIQPINVRRIHEDREAIVTSIRTAADILTAEVTA